MRSGDLLVEVASLKQAQQILKLNSLSAIPISVQPHPQGLAFFREAIPISQLDTSVPFNTAISPNPPPNPTNSLQKCNKRKNKKKKVTNNTIPACKQTNISSVPQDKVVKTNNTTNAGKISQYYKTSHHSVSPPRDTNPLISKFWKTSPRQTAKLQTNSSTASVMNNIATDITNPSQIHTNPASDGKTTEAQCIQNDAEMSTSSASEDILETI
ncbi:hypothetical protein AVEN_46573-1 [Araneus ventricosus]|uniref:Uncharacterized protein n=1 Tax=Araneus ventricosus TaxID=182803 RepID=A0A4Y2ML05_ARAVE|nr:hypothetical protein AVEN_46573-1 [Araneus ventricosus]